MLGAPVTTRDIDLLVRDTPLNREKLQRFCDALGVSRPTDIGATITTQTILGGPWPIDVLFDALSGGLAFASIRSRAKSVAIGDLTATVASIAEVEKT
jgi:hypothetical protein